jgi:beta-lactamase class A
MRRYLLALFAAAAIAGSSAAPANALGLPAPLADLQATLTRAAQRAPGRVAMEVKDLGTGFSSSINANEVMPAASTIKIPVMVEVFRQLQQGTFDLNHRVTLMPRDRDWGSGIIADAPVGSTFPVSELLTQMIAVSDNTAANMLIRLVGRTHINTTMRSLGLKHTRLADYIRTAGWSIRNSLRTSPADMVRLLTDMAQKQLIDEWSSQSMINILERQEINSLIPEPLPQIPIAHKTGSLDDTLNDVGIVYASNGAYVIAVMTTQLPTLSAGRRFIRRVSSMAYTHLQQFGKWRALNTLGSPAGASAADDGSSDTPMWAPQTPVPATPNPESTP